MLVLTRHMGQVLSWCTYLVITMFSPVGVLCDFSLVTLACTSARIFLAFFTDAVISSALRFFLFKYTSIESNFSKFF